jgi:hypothetical protein
VQCFRPHLPPEAINFLTVHTNDVAQIAVPPENRAEHVVKFVEWHLIGDRDQADDHRAHLAQNRSQNQAVEGECFNHLSRLLRSRPPTFWRSRHPHPRFGYLKRLGRNETSRQKCSRRVQTLAPALDADLPHRLPETDSWPGQAAWPACSQGATSLLDINANARGLLAAHFDRKLNRGLDLFQ